MYLTGNMVWPIRPGILKTNLNSLSIKYIWRKQLVTDITWSTIDGPDYFMIFGKIYYTGKIKV